MIRRQIEVNDLANVVVDDRALSDARGMASFSVEACNANSHLSEIAHAPRRITDVVEVSTTTLDIWIDESGLVPDVIKIDVEGAEMLILKGAPSVLTNIRPQIIVSTHSGKLNQQCSTILQEAGYQVSLLKGFEREFVAVPSPADL